MLDYEEIKLSRLLAKAVEDVKRTEGSVPAAIDYAYTQLLALYQKQIDAGTP
jgi:hypothetical protein